jgi:hypothetical protein
MTSPQLATTQRTISQDPVQDPGSPPKDQGLKDPSRTTYVHTRILAEDIVSDQDWTRYLLKYPDEEVTFCNAGDPILCQLGPTLYKINVEWPLSPQPAQQVPVNS